MQHILGQIEASIDCKRRLAQACGAAIEQLCVTAGQTIGGGGKLLLCGNGGSSCDAAHAAGELVGWFLQRNRRPLPAIALGHATPALTAIANDVGFDEVFARELEAIGRAGDLLIGISTSGNSRNVAQAMERARGLGIGTALLTGEASGVCRQFADLVVNVPSRETPRIQECHLLIVHILCAFLESR
jgi:D-sedoheptulose 7-phosphate isomerase